MKGLLDFTQLQDVLTEKTKLVAMGHVSNVLGTINPIQSVIEAAHTVGAKVIVDAAQSVPFTFMLMSNNSIVIFLRSQGIKCVDRPASGCYTVS